MRATTHNSRTNSKGTAHSAKHNDRNFDIKKADNIDPTKAQDNVYWNCFNNPDLTFEQAELRAYQILFGKQLEKTNQSYVDHRHPERCKTMEQFIRSRQHCPEETVLQVGKMEDHIDEKTLIKIYNEYKAEMNQWNNAHGRPFLVLTSAVHVDEAVPHVQQRRAWAYLGEDGIYRSGQEKALKQAGIELPDPSKPEGRYNNRKMTFDKMARDLWLDVCERNGIQVEREPVPGAKHNREKQDMIRDKYEDLQEQVTILQDVLDDSQKAVDDTLQELQIAQEEASEVRQGISALALEKASLEADVADLRADRDRLVTEKRDLTTSVGAYKDHLQVIRKAVSDEIDRGLERFSSADLSARIDAARKDTEKDRRIQALEKALAIYERFTQLPDVHRLWQQFLAALKRDKKRPSNTDDRPGL